MRWAIVIFNSMRTVLTLIAFSFSLLALQAQSLKDLFLKMPQEVCPVLSEYNRLEIVDNQKNDKTTYVTFDGIDKAKAEVERLSTEAADIFASYSKEDNFLKELVLMLINREK